ncbi:MAG: glycoside hydrolase family 27 protein [Lachnospiraceae bacterium]|nr:glycoside hydrolase family 27 protein [Lachnospiraceae bacterium]
MVAQLPPRGWNSWDCYGAAVKEAQVRANAEYIAMNMKEYGYEYVVVDIQWYQPTAGSHEYEPFSDLCMDEYGRLIPAVNRFPSAADGKGFKPLADYIHSLGLKFGIHIMRGMPRMAAHKKLPVMGTDQHAGMVADPGSICAWNPDMYGLKCETNEAGARAYYESIFALYAEWGVDFIKLDDIAREYPRCKREIEIISESLRNCGRDMVLSLSPGPAILETSEHLKQYANMWRITDDFWDQWDALLNMFEKARVWCTHAGPGHWPDADMLPVGALRRCSEPNGWTAFNEAEQRTMMSLWCMMRAPLIVGADLPENDDFTLRLLTNKEVLAIEEKSHCGHELYHTDEEIAWIAPMKKGNGCYIALFNVSDESREMTIDLANYELEKAEKATELWSGKTVKIDSRITTVAEAHDAVIYKIMF